LREGSGVEGVGSCLRACLLGACAELSLPCFACNLCWTCHTALLHCLPR
jgi:hypothetical protein